MIQYIQKWGNSLGLRLPKSITTKYVLNEGSAIVFTLGKKSLSITPLARKSYRLKELVEDISDCNRHGETDWGSAKGREVW